MTGHTNAQGPGFAGKKIILEYGFNISPFIAEPPALDIGSRFKANKSDEFLEEKNRLDFDFVDDLEFVLPILFSHEAQLKYVLSRRQQLGVAYKYSRVGVSNRNNEFEYTGLVTSHTAGISYDIFKPVDGNIAPIGKYINIQLLGIFSSANTLEANIDEEVDLKTDIAIRFNWGANRIIFGHTMLKFEAGLGVTTNFLTSIRGEIESEFIDFNDPNRDSKEIEELLGDVQRNVDGHNFNTNLFSLKIGIVQPF